MNRVRLTLENLRGMSNTHARVPYLVRTKKEKASG